MKFNRCMDTNNMYKEAPENCCNMNNDMMMNQMPMMGMNCCPSNVVMCPPIMECPQVRCCHRVVNYEVPQV